MPLKSAPSPFCQSAKAVDSGVGQWRLWNQQVKGHPFPQEGLLREREFGKSRQPLLAEKQEDPKWTLVSIWFPKKRSPKKGFPQTKRRLPDTEVRTAGRFVPLRPGRRGRAKKDRRVARTLFCCLPQRVELQAAQKGLEGQWEIHFRLTNPKDSRLVCCGLVPRLSLGKSHQSPTSS